MTDGTLGPQPGADISESREVASGAGFLGAPIGMACALTGYPVAIHDLATDSLGRAEADLRSIVGGRVAKERVTTEIRDQAFANLTFTPQLAQAAAAADLVVENLDVTCTLFGSKAGEA